MALHKIITYSAILALASCRDAKLLRTMPTISNSLVNLGKMQISIHFNGKPSDFEPKHQHSFETAVQSDQYCACADFKPCNILSRPTDLINKILRSNDLFNDLSKDPACCGSHEHIQENVLFELIPNHGQNLRENSLFPFSIQNLLKRGNTKPKAVEILLFPKRKDMANFEVPNYTRKETSTSVNQSVKKDLAFTEKKDEHIQEDNLKTITPANNLASNDNLL